MRWAARCHYDWPITTSAATTSARAAAAPQTSQDATRHLAKPASAITRQAAAISSAIDATPLEVSIGLSWGGHCPFTRRNTFFPQVATRAAGRQRGGVIPLIHRRSGVSYSIQIREVARLKVAQAGRAPIVPAPPNPRAPRACMRTRDPGRVPKNIAGVFRFRPQFVLF
jgi:hypothetical protein